MVHCTGRLALLSGLTGTAPGIPLDALGMARQAPLIVHALGRGEPFIHAWV